MRILVNHLTRMSAPHVCVAGLDIETGTHIRPLPFGQRLDMSSLASRGGIFDLGTIIDLGPVTPCGQPPEIEDVRFRLDEADHVSPVFASKFWERLESAARSSLSDIFGPDLRPDGKRPDRSKRSVPIGGGAASLGCLRLRDAPTLTVGPWQNVEIRFDDGSGTVVLAVTDVRFMDESLKKPMPAVVNRVAADLRRTSQVILSVGLGRPYCPPDDGGPKRHWLQVNNVFFAEDPLWRP